MSDLRAYLPEFLHPWFLLLLLGIVPALWAAQRNSLADLTVPQRHVCIGLRSVILLSLVLSLAGVQLLLPSRRVAAVYAVDASASVSDSALAEARSWIEQSIRARLKGDYVGVLGFSKNAEVWEVPNDGRKELHTWPALKDRAGSDLGKALDFGSSLLPTEGARRLVLLSDGNDTGNQAVNAARRLAEAGVELITVPLHTPAAPEVLVERVDIPRRLRTGEHFDLAATIRSTVATTATVKLYQNQFLLRQEPMELKRGANTFSARDLQTEGTFASFQVEVVPAQDTAMENNSAVATVNLQGEPRVLLIDPDEQQIRPLAETLRTEKINIETRGSAGLPKSLEDLQQYDLLMLSDVPALSLGREQMELYRRWVQDFGGGFVMLGGENSYGVGGYYRTPIEQMLPVRMEHEDRQETPSVALLVVLDRSGSMTAQVQGQTKMSLANQGAVFAMNALQPKDYFGVLAVDTRTHIVAAMGQLASKGSAEHKILSVTAGGGGIYIYTSLAEAFHQLKDISARIKHVILFSDAADAEEKTAGDMSDGMRSGGSALDLASAMLSAKITTSVVALGTEQDKDTAFLRQLAERGNGRFYLTSDATTLPQIFSTETMKVAQSSLVEEPFLAVPMSPSPATAGLDWPQSPLLLGYNATKVKPTADLLLATERGEPLLATWRYGLGHAAAFTSDAKSRWAAEWLGWHGYGKFWTQLVRALMRRGEQATFRVTAVEAGDRLKLAIDAVTPTGGFQNRLAVQVHALQPDGQTETQSAQQEAPGRYTAILALPIDGTTIISISSPSLPEGAYVFGHTRSYPREFLTMEPNEQLLRSIASETRGTFDPAPEEVFRRPRAVPVRQDLSPWLLAAALLLFPVDIWLRRRTWGSATA